MVVLKNRREKMGAKLSWKGRGGREKSRMLMGQEISHDVSFSQGYHFCCGNEQPCSQKSSGAGTD